MGRLFVWTVVLSAFAWAASVSPQDGTQSKPDISAGSAELQLVDGIVRADVKGLDKCGAPSHSDLDAFWAGTDWYWWGIYIGGSNMSCPNNNVTSAYINQEVGPWKMLFLWVGPQPPCTGYASTFPSNTSAAYDEGRTVAQNAHNHAIFDLDLVDDDLPLVYDLEPFDTNNATCLAATKAFLRGWTSYLHQGAVTQRSGVYGGCQASLDSFYGISPNPDFIWGADWDGDSHTSSLACIPNNHWGDRRHKQYYGEVLRTENGVTLEVDVNCAAGPMYGESVSAANPACS